MGAPVETIDGRQNDRWRSSPPPPSERSDACGCAALFRRPRRFSRPRGACGAGRPTGARGFSRQRRTKFFGDVRRPVGLAANEAMAAAIRRKPHDVGDLPTIHDNIFRCVPRHGPSSAGRWGLPQVREDEPPQCQREKTACSPPSMGLRSSAVPLRPRLYHPRQQSAKPLDCVHHIGGRSTGRPSAYGTHKIR